MSFINVEDPCRVKPCYHGGTCSITEDNEASCECTPHWEGDQCQIGKDSLFETYFWRKVVVLM